MCACKKTKLGSYNENLLMYTSIQSTDATQTSTGRFQENDQIGIFALTRADRSSKGFELYETTSGKKINNIESNVAQNGKLNITQKIVLPSENEYIDIFSYYPYTVGNEIVNASTPVNLPVLEDQRTNANFKKSASLVASNMLINNTVPQPIKNVFSHIHSKLNFSFLIGKGYDNLNQIKTLRLTINGVPAVVQYDIIQQKTTPDFTNMISVNPFGTLETDKIDNTKLSGFSAIIPAFDYSTSNPLSIKISVDNGTFQYTVNFAKALEKGKYYNITYTLTKFEHNFTATIAGWVEGGTIEVDADHNS